MKCSSLLAVSLATAVAALSILDLDQQTVLGGSSADDRYLIELAGGEQRWIKEDEKWSLKRVRLILANKLLL